jgi:hypothetical protein
MRGAYDGRASRGCRRGDTAIMRRRTDASTTRNDTPSTAAVERVLWARRHREARPLAAPVAVPIVARATHRLSRSGWARRWVIRWAEPGRTGPYQAQRRAPARATILAHLQVFRRVDAPRTPCFTRERSQVRNPPRPSSEVPVNQHVSPARASTDVGPGKPQDPPLGHSLGRTWASDTAARSSGTRDGARPAGHRRNLRAAASPLAGPAR